MSQENVEAMRRLIDAWKAGDREAWLALSHPDIEWSSGILRQVEGGDAVYRGRTEVGQFWDDWGTLWDLDIEVSEFRDLGDTVLNPWAEQAPETGGKRSRATDQGDGPACGLMPALRVVGEAQPQFEPIGRTWVGHGLAYRVAPWARLRLLRSV